MTVPAPAPRTFACPLRAVDSFEVRETDTCLVVHARKTVTAADPYMAGHFPEVTLYPAVFLLEGVRQSVGSALRRSAAMSSHVWGSSEDRWLELNSLRSLRVVKPMLEGDDLHLDIEVTIAGEPGVVHAKVRCRRGCGPLVATITVDLVCGGGVR